MKLSCLQDGNSQEDQRSMGEATILPYQNRVSTRSFKTSHMLTSEFSELAIEARKRNRTDDLDIYGALNDALHTSQTDSVCPSNEKDTAHQGIIWNIAEKLPELKSVYHCEAMTSGYNQGKQATMSVDSPPMFSTLCKASSTPNPQQ